MSRANLDLVRNFKIVWKLISETRSDDTRIREYVSDSPMKGCKYYKHEEDNPRAYRSHIWVR